MGDFAAPKLSTIKVAIIGCGARASLHCRTLASYQGTEIVGVCDIYPDLVEKRLELIKKSAKDDSRHSNIKVYHGDKHAYKKMLAETKPDLVYIITPWQWHAPMAIDAMNAGAHACVEVPLCTTIEEAWRIIDTSEKTQRHCMMLENCNYGREELMYLNLCRQGVLGQLLHGEAAYIHDLRHQMASIDRGRGTGFWRTPEWASKSGNLYPTHGLGPVAQYMNLARGEDNFRRLVSYSSPGLNHELYVKERFPAESKLNQIDFTPSGDINTSIIKTELGRTVMVQWDESSPRPYSRHNLIQGTRGTAAGYPSRIALDYGEGEGLAEKIFNMLPKKRNRTNFHSWCTDINAFYEVYDHPLYKRTLHHAKEMGGHGGMDAIMNFRVVECLLKGEPLDQNVYEGCYWSAVAPLSIKSVKEDGMPQDFPDFTRGRWKETKPLGIVS